MARKNNKTVTALRWIVGLLFILSGLLKANDPHGLSYKIQEYFENWHMAGLNDYSLILAISMNVFEVLAGVAIILGYAMPLFSWLLLLLVIAFGFLTGYASLSGRFKTCGCMGDCLPIPPFASFIKDVVLLVMILVIFRFRKVINPIVRSAFLNFILLVSTTVFVLILQLYVLKNLPYIDCLPYKTGNHLLKEMSLPEGAVADSVQIVFQYKKDGKIVEFDANSFPKDFDSTYEYVNRVDKIIKKGNTTPKIQDFALITINGSDTTHSLLNNPNKKILVFTKNLEALNLRLASFQTLMQKAKEKNIPVMIVSPNLNGALVHSSFANVIALKLDPVVTKTVARANPTYILLEGDKIIAKESYNQVNAFTQHL